MKNTNKIIILVVFLTLGIMLWHNFSDMKSKSKVESTNNENSVELSKSENNNKVEVNETKTEVKAFSNIVIYNTHADEGYVSGKKITEAASLINDKLNKEGLNSSFIKCNPPKEYTKAYEVSRDAIKKNVKEYAYSVLLDIHRDLAGDGKTNTKRMILTLTKKNPRYEVNKKFAESLSKEINKSQGVKCEILLRDYGVSYYNQDLSDNSVLIELGNDKSSDSDVEECINALVLALKNVQTAL